MTNSIRFPENLSLFNSAYDWNKQNIAYIYTHHGDHLFYHPVNKVANTTCFKTYTAKRLTNYLIYKNNKTHVFRRTHSSFNHSPPWEIQKEDNKMWSLFITVAILTSWRRSILNASRRCSAWIPTVFDSNIGLYKNRTYFRTVYGPFVQCSIVYYLQMPFKGTHLHILEAILRVIKLSTVCFPLRTRQGVEVCCEMCGREYF